MSTSKIWNDLGYDETSSDVWDDVSIYTHTDGVLPTVRFARNSKSYVISNTGNKSSLHSVCITEPLHNAILSQIEIYKIQGIWGLE